MDIRSAVRAARDGQASIVQQWLDAGGDPDFTDGTGIRLLHIAAGNRHDTIVEVLLARKANPDVINGNGRTPLCEALNESSCKNLEKHRERGNAIVRALLAAKADPAQGTELPLAEAAKWGNVEAIRLLLEAGAHVSQGHPQYGRTALIEAVNGTQPEVVALLLQAGADVNQADRRGQTPLIRAIANPGTAGDCEDRRTLCLALARFLVDKGANVNQAMEDGCSPLMYAVNENWPAMINFLLDAGADPRHVDARGCGLARRALDGALRLQLADGPAFNLVAAMVGAGAGDAKGAAEWARKRGRASLAEAIEKLAP